MKFGLLSLILCYLQPELSSLNMNRIVFSISLYTFHEAVRNRLFAMMLIGMICMIGLTEFIGELAITETKQIQRLLLASGLRIFSVCIVGLFVITSMVREFNDKGLEMLLSLPITRSSYYLGKFTGFVLLSIIIACAAALVLSIYSHIVYVMFWLVSLICELLIIIALSLLCMFTFSHTTIVFVTVIAFYLLSRSMSSIQLISNSRILEIKTFSQEFFNTVLDSIAFVLPALDKFSNSEWLVYGADLNQLTIVFIQTIIYLALLMAAGLFDLYRKNF